jgi:hypothetical protein
MKENIPQLTRELTDKTRTIVENAAQKARKIYCGRKQIVKTSYDHWLIFYDGQTPSQYNSLDEAWRALLINNDGETPWIQPMNANVWAVIEAARDYVSANVSSGTPTKRREARTKLLRAIDNLVVEE